LTLPVLTLPAWGETPQETRELIRKALAGFNREDERRGDFLFNMEGERKEFEADGRIKTQRSWKSRREIRDGLMIGYMVERDGKPLDAAEMAKQEEAIRKSIAEHKALTPQERERRRAEARKKREANDGWIQEFPEALDYKLLGEEMLNGRLAYKFAMTPRPGYKARSMQARIFEKMRGTMWVDKADGEMARGEAEMFDTVNVGFGVLGKIEKGTQFAISRRKVTQDLWLADMQRFKFDARIMLVKSMRQESVTRFTDYRHRSEAEAKAAQAR
jgi:hypothetical protein